MEVSVAFLALNHTLDKVWSDGVKLILAVFTCVGALAIAGALDKINVDLLGWWLCERQLPSGGLNGRPEKLADVQYGFIEILIIVGLLFLVGVVCSCYHQSLGLDR